MLYLDSSAIVKLVAPEPETDALMSFLGTDPERVSSALAFVEVCRAVQRLGGDEALLRRARQVLSRISLIKIDNPVIRTAAELDPQMLRSLDAIHLATALSTVEPVAALVTYDSRLRDASRLSGIAVESPA